MGHKSLPKPPRVFDGGAVGLGIVAAMSAAKPTPPVPIVSPRPRDAAAFAAKQEEEEMSESYTCVISHVTGGAVRRRDYFDDGWDGVISKYGTSPGVFFQSPPPPPAPVKLKAIEFLNRCYLCPKSLHGLDIFIYRGDKAFCSSECRCQHILKEGNTEKCSYGARMQFEYSVCSCSDPLVLGAGVAAT